MIMAMTTARKITCTGLVFTLYFMATLASSTKDQAEMPHRLNTYKKKYLNFLLERLLKANGIILLIIPVSCACSKRRLNNVLHN